MPTDSDSGGVTDPKTGPGGTTSTDVPVPEPVPPIETETLDDGRDPS